MQAAIHAIKQWRSSLTPEEKTPTHGHGPDNKGSHQKPENETQQ